MKCNDVREKFVAYIDGELSSMGRHAIKAHLGNCKECATECEKLREAVESIHQAAPIQPAEDWWEKLRERIHVTESDVVSELRELRESVVRLEDRVDGSESGQTGERDYNTGRGRRLCSNRA